MLVKLEGVSAQKKKTYNKIHCSLDRYTTILNDPFFHAFFVLKLPVFVCPQSQLYGGMGFLGTAVSFESTQFTNSQDTHLRISA